jgi:hypothetical protein
MAEAEDKPVKAQKPTKRGRAWTLADGRYEVGRTAAGTPYARYGETVYPLSDNARNRKTAWADLRADIRAAWREGEEEGEPPSDSDLNEVIADLRHAAAGKDTDPPSSDEVADEIISARIADEAATAAPCADVPGAVILDEIEALVRRYLVVPDEHCWVALVLWAAHTHAVEAFYVTPRLILDSAEPESGKTRVLELLALLVNRPKMTFNTTVAALYRRLQNSMLTLLLDEADAIWSAKAGPQAEELRAFVNAGYKRGATVDRCVGEGSSMQVVEFPVFAPVAIAGISGNLPRTITTRGIIIHMRRRAPGEHVEPFEEQDALAAANPLRAQLAHWVGTVAGDLQASRPEMPAGVVDRKAEIWRALLAVADAAGGDWPKRAREACEYFALGTQAASASLGTRLLADLKEIFDGRDRMKTTDILPALIRMEEAPWGEMRGGKPLDARKLSDLLRRYDVAPTAFDLLDGTGKTAKGYTTFATKGNGGLHDAWQRYITGSAALAGKDGKDGEIAGQDTDRSDGLTGTAVSRNSGAERLTDLTVSRDSGTGAPTSEVTGLTALTAESGEMTRACPDCGELEDSRWHAVECLGQDPAA